MDAYIGVPLTSRLGHEVGGGLLGLSRVRPRPLPDGRELVVTSVGTPETGLQGGEGDEKPFVLAENVRGKGFGPVEDLLDRYKLVAHRLYLSLRRRGLGEPPALLARSLERRFGVCTALARGQLHDTGERPPAGLLVIHVKHNRLVVEVGIRKVLTELKGTPQDSLGKPSRLGGVAARVEAERGAGEY